MNFKLQDQVFTPRLPKNGKVEVMSIIYIFAHMLPLYSAQILMNGVNPPQRSYS